MSSAKKKNSNRLKASDPTVLIARELSAIAEAHGVAELVYKTSDLKVIIRRGQAVSTAAAMPIMPAMPVGAPAPLAVAAAPSAPVAAAAPATAAEPEDSGHVVTSPFVGTFYRSPNPDSPAYVEVGQRIEKGQVLCIVEAMKLMNEIEADVGGTITSILVQNAAPVEYGQPLFKIDPA